MDRQGRQRIIARGANSIPLSQPSLVRAFPILPSEFTDPGTQVSRLWHFLRSQISNVKSNVQGGGSPTILAVRVETVAELGVALPALPSAAVFAIDGFRQIEDLWTRVNNGLPIALRQASARRGSKRRINRYGLPTTPTTKGILEYVSRLAFQLQFNAQLEPTNWTDYGGLIYASELTLTNTVVLTPTTQGFLRVQQFSR